MEEQHSFILKKAKIKERVEKLTSYLGKMRDADGRPLFDRLALTDGEDFLRDDFLVEAAGETYDWIKAFGRHKDGAFRIFPDDAIIKPLYENHGAHIFANGKIQRLKYSLPLSSTDYTITTVSTTEYLVSINMPTIDVNIGYADAMDYQIAIHYTAGIAGTPIQEERVLIVGPTAATQDVTISGSLSQTIQFRETFQNISVLSVDSVDVEIVSVAKHVVLSKGDFIYFADYDDNRTYAVVTEDYDSDEDDKLYCERYDGDVRDAVVYIVMLPDWSDRNMLPIVEDSLLNAIVDYIIYRWLELVLPKEAEVYYDKWEDKGRKAQLGLNTENRTLHRRATWL